MALIEELDDRTLVEQHRAGDAEAFRRIVVRHHRSLYANALRRLGDPVLAEDAVQETFLRAFRNLDRFDGDYHLDAWLHRIVTNACHDMGRRRGRDSRLFDRACTEVEVEAPPADDGIGVVPDPQFGAALDQLPESYREVLILRFVEEMSYSDVAEKAGISEENARARVSRGRNMLKKMMTSASGLVIWAIPPLRRAQMQVQDPDVAAQAAQQVHNVTGITNAVSTVGSTGGFGQLSNLVAQAGPVIANAGPAVTSTGPVVKAAMAAGLAAAVAIPTGVAVDRAMQKPVPRSEALVIEESAGPVPGAVTAPEVAASSTPTSSTPPATVGALSAGPTVAVPISGSDSTQSSTPTSAPTQTASPTSETSTSEPSKTAPEPTPTPTTQPAPPAEEPAPARTAGISSGSLRVEDAGPHAVRLTGPISLAVGEETIAAEVDGKLAVSAAGPKDANAPREVDATLILTLDDGSSLELRLKGTGTVTESAGERVLELTAVRFTLSGGSDLDLPAQGDLTGSLRSASGTGRLVLTLTETSS